MGAGPRAAKEIAEERKEERKAREEEEKARRPRTMAELLRAMQEEGRKELNLILRADTQGSLEAIQHILARESTEDVKINILLAQVGAPTESDVLLAQTANAAILAFGVNPPGSVKKKAEEKGVLLKTFRIIYDLVDEVRNMVKGQREPQYKEEVLGQAEVRAIFRLPTGKQVAGCMVTQGRIPRNAEVRVLRDGQVIWQGRIASLKRFKEDVREVAQGYECGIGLDGFDDFREGDVIGPSRWWRSPPKAMLRLLALLALCLYGAERLPEAPKGAEGLFAPGPILAKQEERSPLLPAPPVPEARRGLPPKPWPSALRPKAGEGFAKAEKLFLLFARLQLEGG